MSRAGATDVLVVGGGPAGSAAALTLARKGARVTLAERSRLGRDKCCGDGLTTAALRALESLGVDPRPLPSFAAAHRIAVRSPEGRVVELPLPDRPGLYGAAVRRTELDALLLETAAAAGVDVRTQDGFAGFVECPDPAGRGRLVVRLARGAEVRAQAVVAADGAWSPLRHALETGAPAHTRRSSWGRRPAERHDWHAFRAYVLGAPPRAFEQLAVVFERRLLPGYAWAFPLGDGAVNVGVGVERRAATTGGELARAWQVVEEDPWLRSLLGGGRASSLRSWPIPCDVREAPGVALGGRVLFAGDAARAADPMTGEGIAQALETGAAAARALLSADLDPAGAARAYGAFLAARLAPDHRLASGLSALLSSPRAAEAALAVVSLNGWTRRNVARWLFEDYPRALLFTPRRWHRGLLPASGAFAVAGMPART